jgi:hypothetical protein
MRREEGTKRNYAILFMIAGPIQRFEKGFSRTEIKCVFDIVIFSVSLIPIDILKYFEKQVRIPSRG